MYIHRERKNQKRERESERHKSEIVTVREIEK